MPSHTFTNPSHPPVANVPYLHKDKKMRTNNPVRYQTTRNWNIKALHGMESNCIDRIYGVPASFRFPVTLESIPARKIALDHCH